MGLIHLIKSFGLTIRESADDGSDFSNPDADYRVLFLGEDGFLHVKDSSGTVTDPFDPSGSGSVATDTIWDTKGDIAAATGSNAAAKVAATGVSGAYLVEDTGASTGLKFWKRKVVYKSADESVSNTTLQDDDHLVVAIGASEEWVFEANLFVTNAASTGDFKFLFTAPASATIIRYGVIGSATGITSADASDVRVQAIDTGVALPVGVVASGTIGIQPIRIFAYVQNSTNAGNVTLQWAQNSTDGSNATVVKRGSFMVAERVA